MGPFVPFTSFKSHTHSAFAENTFYFLKERLKINAGFRVDQQENPDPSWTPRGGIVFKPGYNSSLKLLFGRGLRAPNAWEVNNARNDGLGETFPARETENLEVDYIRNARLGNWSLNNNFSAYHMTSTHNFNQVLVGATYHLVFVGDETIDGTEDFLRVSYFGRSGGFFGGAGLFPPRSR